jgi:hypothetical protein
MESKNGKLWQIWSADHEFPEDWVWGVKCGVSIFSPESESMLLEVGPQICIDLEAEKNFHQKLVLLLSKVINEFLPL